MIDLSRTIGFGIILALLCPGLVAMAQDEHADLWKLYEEKDFQTVIDRGRQLLEEDQGNRALHHLVGRAIVDADHNLQADEAIKHLQLCMRGLPADHWMLGWSHFYIGRAYEISGRPAKAVDAYELAIAVNTTSACTTSAKARLRGLNNARLVKVVEDMQAHYTKDQYAVVARLGRDFVNSLSGKTQQIDDPLFYHYYGRALIENGNTSQFKDAIGQLQHSLELADGRRWITGWNHYYMGLAYEQLGELDKAHKHLQAAVDLQATTECTQSAQFKLRHLGKDPYAGWMTHETTHFILRYPPSSRIVGRPHLYSNRLEMAHANICSFLRIKPRGKITLYLYDSKAQGLDITGKELGWADRKNQTVHQHIGQTIGHEMTHCLSHQITRGEYCDSVVINEGLAVYLDQTQRDKHAEARSALRFDTLPSFSELESTFRDRPDAYPLAGSFVGFLLEAYNLDLFTNFWRASANGEYESAFKQHYAKSSDELTAEWKDYLKSDESRKSP